MSNNGLVPGDAIPMSNCLPELDMECFGGELYALRSMKQLTQAEVAKRAGLGRGYYSQLENSRKPAPPPRTVKRIAMAMHLEPAQIESLEQIAIAERNSKLNLPRETSVQVANIVKKLIRPIGELSADKLARIEAILIEGTTM